MTSFDLIFDNAGGITLQAEGYCHTFGDAKEAAGCVSEMLDGADPAYWESNEPEGRQEYDNAAERSGAYQWVSDSDVYEAVGQMPEEEREDYLEAMSGCAQREFFVRLFELRDAAYAQQ